MDGGRNKSRRDFLKNCLAGGVVLGTGGKLALLEAAEHTSLPLEIEGRNRARSDAARHGNHGGFWPDAEPARSSMQTLFELDHPSEPWKKLVRPGEKVGIKVNALGGRVSSNLQLVEAICERLQEAGIRASDIVIWDRDTDELGHVGFHVVTEGNRVQCFGSDRVGYEDELATYGSVGSRLSKILTQRCDAIVNVPVLKDHDGAGVTIALKNMYGVIHNPNKYHPNGCNPYIADLNMLPAIRTKVRLTICDATTACFEGGPGFKPQYSWKENALIVSQDPVALDYTGWRIIERKRAEKGLKTLEADKRAPHYIATAADAQHRLGTNDPQRIGWLRCRQAT